MTIPLECFADNLLAGPPAIHVRGVEKIDAGVDSSIDNSHRFRLADFVSEYRFHCSRSGPEHQAAKAERAHLHAGPAQTSVLHRSGLRWFQSIGSKKVRSAPKLSIAMT